MPVWSLESFYLSNLVNYATLDARSKEKTERNGYAIETKSPTNHTNIKLML
jgi:hypothetical protein